MIIFQWSIVAVIKLNLHPSLFKPILVLPSSVPENESLVENWPLPKKLLMDFLRTIAKPLTHPSHRNASFEYRDWRAGIKNNSPLLAKTFSSGSNPWWIADLQTWFIGVTEKLTPDKRLATSQFPRNLSSYDDQIFLYLSVIFAQAHCTCCPGNLFARFISVGKWINKFRILYL